MTRPDELRAMVQHSCEYVGECDACHYDPLPVFVNSDGEEPFIRCAKCWVDEAKKLERSAEEVTS